MILHEATCLKGPKSRARRNWKKARADAAIRHDLVARVRRKSPPAPTTRRKKWRSPWSGCSRDNGLPDTPPRQDARPAPGRAFRFCPVEEAEPPRHQETPRKTEDRGTEDRDQGRARTEKPPEAAVFCPLSSVLCLPWPSWHLGGSFCGGRESGLAAPRVAAIMIFKNHSRQASRHGSASQASRFVGRGWQRGLTSG